MSRSSKDGAMIAGRIIKGDKSAVCSSNKDEIKAYVALYAVLQ
jgi:hypothetical protein